MKVVILAAALLVAGCCPCKPCHATAPVEQSRVVFGHVQSVTVGPNGGMIVRLADRPRPFLIPPGADIYVNGNAFASVDVVRWFAATASVRVKLTFCGDRPCKAEFFKGK